MSIELPPNITALISSLNVKSNPLAKTLHEPEVLPSVVNSPVFSHDNKLLRIKILIQINKLVSELKVKDAESSSGGATDEQRMLKIIILQLRIELIKLESKIISQQASN